MASEEHITEESPQLPIAPSGVRDAARAEIDRLDAFVDGLSLEDWKKRSAVKEWSIGEVVAHLNLALALYRRILGAAAKGRGSGKLWKAFGDFTKKAAPAGVPIFNTLNSAVPRLIGGALSPEVVKGQFAASARGLRESLDQIGPNDYTRPVHFMGRPWPLSFFLAAIVNELAVHGWDMMSTLDSDAHLSAAARDVLPWFYFGGTDFMFQRPAGFAATIQVKLQDPSAEMWWAIRGDEITTGVGEDVKSDATITGETGTFVLVLAGRIGVDDAIRTTSISAEGEEELARSFLGAWRIL